MPIAKKHEVKTKAASIGFRNGMMKDEIVSILHEPGLQELMPEEVKGVLGAELHWAVVYMKKLHDRGRLDTPLPMFAPESAETIGMREQINRLNGDLNKLLDLTKKMAEFQTGAFECQKNENGDIEITIYKAHRVNLEQATEVRVWDGSGVITGK